jgi:hypothetical protein
MGCAVAGSDCGDSDDEFTLLQEINSAVISAKTKEINLFFITNPV